MNWNEQVAYQLAALEFMGLPPPPAKARRLGFDFLDAPTPKVRRCRTPGPRPAVEYPYPHPAAPRPWSLFVRTPLSPAERAFKPESDRIQAEMEHLRPLDPPDDCRPGMPGAIRPCPWVSCKHNLAVTRNASGSIKIDHGHTDLELLEETCVIDVTAKGAQTQETVARLLGITTDWVRAAERDIRASLVRKVRKVSSDWTAADEDGRQTCVPCRGSGEASGIDCLNCDGDGYRWRAAKN